MLASAPERLQPVLPPAVRIFTYNGCVGHAKVVLEGSSLGVAPEGNRVLHIEGVSKSYGSIRALDQVDLTVERGEVVALLGPNGAGKTSLVSIAAGLRRPDGGSVRVGDADVLASPEEARRHIGVAPQELGVCLTVTVRHNLELFGALAGLRRKALAVAIDETAAALGLSELLDRHASRLSGGERRRVHTAIALLHRPPLLLLDEATVGADVHARAEILGVVRRLAAEGSAILYSTHYMGEVEALSPSVTILDHGRVIARGTVAELLARHASKAAPLELDHPQTRGANLESVFLALTGRAYDRNGLAPLDHDVIPR